MRVMGPAELLVILLVLGVTLALIAPFCMISKRLGYSPWWGLLIAPPLGIVVWAYYVAFAKWPTESASRGAT